MHFGGPTTNLRLRRNYNLLVIDTVRRPSVYSGCFPVGGCSPPKGFPRAARALRRTLAPSLSCRKTFEKLCTSTPREFSITENSRTTLNAEKQEESQ